MRRAETAKAFVTEMRERGIVTLDCDAFRYHLALLLGPEGHPALKRSGHSVCTVTKESEHGEQGAGSEGHGMGAVHAAPSAPAAEVRPLLSPGVLETPQGRVALQGMPSTEDVSGVVSSDALPAEDAKAVEEYQAFRRNRPVEPAGSTVARWWLALDDEHDPSPFAWRNEAEALEEAGSSGMVLGPFVLERPRSNEAQVGPWVPRQDAFTGETLYEASTAGAWCVGGTEDRVMVEATLAPALRDRGQTVSAYVICDVLPTEPRDGVPARTALENARIIARALNADDKRVDKAEAVYARLKAAEGRPLDRATVDAELAAAGVNVPAYLAKVHRRIAEVSVAENTSDRDERWDCPACMSGDGEECDFHQGKSK